MPVGKWRGMARLRARRDARGNVRNATGGCASVRAAVAGGKGYGRVATNLKKVCKNGKNTLTNETLTCNCLEDMYCMSLPQI